MCQRCVEDLSDTGRYSWRNADPEELEGKVEDTINWPEEGYEVDGTIESLKRLGHAIEDGTIHKGNGQWLVRFAQALQDANHGPDFCGRGYCPICFDRLHNDDRPHGEMQPIVDRMEAGDPDEERYEAWLDAEDAHLEADYEDRFGEA